MHPWSSSHVCTYSEGSSTGSTVSTQCSCEDCILGTKLEREGLLLPFKHFCWSGTSTKLILWILLWKCRLIKKWIFSQLWLVQPQDMAEYLWDSSQQDPLHSSGSRSKGVCLPWIELMTVRGDTDIVTHTVFGSPLGLVTHLSPVLSVWHKLSPFKPQTVTKCVP